MTAAAGGMGRLDPTFLRAAIHAVGEGLTLADRDGRIVYSNPAADRILGVSATHAPPEEWADHYGVFLPDRETPFPADRYPLVLALNGQSTDDVEMFVRNEAIPDGAIISVTGRPLRSSHGEIIGGAVVFRDVTKERRNEEQKKELTGFLVHDMKNPLSAILANCDYVLGSDSLGEAESGAITDIRREAERLHKMVLNLLDIQAAEDHRLEPRLEPIDLPDLLEEVARSIRASADAVELIVNRPEGSDVPKVAADRAILRRVIVNLVDNCLKYGPCDGRIWLEASPSRNDFVRLSVSDEGPGVPVDLREEIFRPYAKVERDSRRRDPTSRGLGLRFCRVAIEAHGGRIWVEDNAPVGARFCVEIPTPT